MPSGYLSAKVAWRNAPDRSQLASLPVTLVRSDELCTTVRVPYYEPGNTVPVRLREMTVEERWVTPSAVPEAELTQWEQVLPEIKLPVGLEVRFVPAPAIDVNPVQPAGSARLSGGGASVCIALPLLLAWVSLQDAIVQYA